MCECEYCTYCQLWLSDLIITQTQRLYSVQAAGSSRGVRTNISLLICILLTPPLLPATAAKWVINKFSPLHIWSQRKSLQTHNTASNQESYEQWSETENPRPSLTRIIVARAGAHLASWSVVCRPGSYQCKSGAPGSTITITIWINWNIRVSFVNKVKYQIYLLDENQDQRPMMGKIKCDLSMGIQVFGCVLFIAGLC